MQNIGFDPATVGLATAVFYIVVLICEIPSGVLSDRWSRKGVLMLASIMLSLSSFIGGVSSNVSMYMVALCVWGVFFAMSSGIYDTLVYDTLLEEKGHTKAYEKYYGKLRMMEGLGYVLSSLTSGVLAQILNLRLLYLVSIPFSLLAIVFILKFREPTMHKQDEMAKLIPHIKETLAVVYKKREAFWMVLALVFLAVGVRLISEFFQLWYIALGLPVLLYGPATAMLQSGFAISGILASRLKNQIWLRWLMMGVLVLSILALMIKSLILVVLALPLSLAGFLVLSIFLSHDLHNTLPSKVRSGSSSAVSSLGQIIFVPISLGFGWLSKEYSIFNAAFIIVIILLIILLSYSRLVNPFMVKVKA